MARSKSYKRKNVHNLRKSRQYKHLGGNTCSLTITTKKTSGVPEEFKKKDFFDITYNQTIYRIVWDISWLDKTLNKGTYSFLIYTSTNNNFNTEPEKMKSIDILIDKLKGIFGKNYIYCLTKISTILSPQSKDDTFKDNVFAHLRNKLLLVIANSRIATVDINKKRRDNLIIYRNQLFVCKIRKEYPDIYNNLIKSELANLSVFNNLNTDLDLGVYDTSIKKLAEKIKGCNATPSTTNSQAELIGKLQQEILNLKKQQYGIGIAGDQQSRMDGLGGSEVCKPRENEIYKNIYTDIYNQIRSILYTLGSSKKDSLKLVASADNLDVIKQNNIDNFLILNEAINERIRESNLKTTIAPPTVNLDELKKLREKDSKWTNLTPYLVQLIALNKELIDLYSHSIPSYGKELSDKSGRLSGKITEIRGKYGELINHDRYTTKLLNLS